MTDQQNLTKAELAAIIGGMTASQIKKTSHADLVQMAADTRNKEPRVDRFASRRLRPLAAEQQKPTKATAPKRGGDVILFLPVDSQKEPRAGSKRATIIDLLRATEGTTIDDIAAATGWKRDVAASALYVDVKGSGFGVERRDGRLHLLPQLGK